MKKLLLLLFLTVATVTITACGKEKAEIALVTDVGSIDDESFNQASWEGIKRYADEKGVTYRYYQPSEDSDDARLTSIRQAIRNGAKIVVLPGFMFESIIKDLEDKFTEVKFVILDVAPANVKDNIYTIAFREEQAGFLAGYAIVKDGYTKLGFLGGMELPAVQKFGYGFIQGVDVAAKELDKQVEIKYHYGGKFTGSPEITARMETWYTSGTEVVFACGGGIYTSALEAAKKITPKGKVIGVDVDQASIDELIITSAMKGLSASVYDTLDIFFKGNWETIAGKVATLGLKEGENYIGLPTKDTSWRFKTFTKAQYEQIKDKIINGTITISGDISTMPSSTPNTIINEIK